MNVRILNCGDAAVTVEFGKEISPEIGGAVKNLDAVIREAGMKGIVETIPTFRSLTVVYEPLLLPYGKLRKFLKKAIEIAENRKSDGAEKVIHVIPVLYDGEDLADVAKLNGLTEEQVVQIHTSTDYLIYMLGFLPGFAYLGGLDKRIETPRLESPRTKIPAGSVGIGGNQTGIYPLASPGGWRLIGRTPVMPFDLRRAEPILYKSGEYIRFEPITASQFEQGEARYRVIREAVE